MLVLVLEELGKVAEVLVVRGEGDVEEVDTDTDIGVGTERGGERYQCERHIGREAKEE